MVVVPALALFSHRLPPEVMQHVRERVWGPLQAKLGWSTVEPAPAPALTPAVADVPAPRVADAASVAPASGAEPATGAGGRLAPVPEGPRRAEEQLARLGATAIECRPVPGDAGSFRAVCHVAIDPAGQLQRVFQATGRDPGAALDRLLADVEPWRNSLAAGADTPAR